MENQEEKTKNIEEGIKQEVKNDEINNDQNLSILQEILKSNQEILKSNEEIAASSDFLRRYVRNRIIIATVKWVLVIAVLVLGFMSFSSVFDYVRENIDYYENKANQVLEFRDVLDNY